MVDVHAGVETVGGGSTLEDTQTGTKTRLDSTFLFAKDSASLLPGARPALDGLAAALKVHGPGRVTITGYTDDLGSAEHGLQLSQQRATAVADVLRRHLPAMKYPMTIRGRGEKDPAVPNTSEVNRRKNRRVLVTLTRTKATPATTETQRTPTAPGRSATTTPTPMTTQSGAATATATAQPTPTPSAMLTTPAASTSAPAPAPRGSQTADDHRFATPAPIPAAPPVAWTLRLTPLGRVALSLVLAVAILGACAAWFRVRRHRGFHPPAEARASAAAPGSPAELAHRQQLTGGINWEVDDVDQALRHVAVGVTAGEPPPSLAAAEIHGGTLTLHLARAANLPAPWRSGADSMTWTCTRRAWRPALTVDGIDAPYPLLVTVGHTDRGASWLLNLAELGTVTITGEPSHGRDFARYLAADLATTPWASDVSIQAADLGAAAALLSSRREDRRSGRQGKMDASDGSNQTRLVFTDATNKEGAATGTETEATVPPTSAVVVLADTSAAGSCELHIDGQARLSLPGTDNHVQAVQLTASEAMGCAALMTASTTSATRHREAADKIWVKEDIQVGAAHTTLLEEMSAAPHQEPKPADPPEFAFEGDGLDADVASWFADTCTRPRLTLLGPVTARALGSPLARRKPYYVELLAYLALHANGATPDELAEAFTITVPRVRNDIKVLRDWLGTDRRTGRRHLPDARDTAAARTRGIGTYQVEGLLTDLHLFTQLRDRGEANGPDGILDLRRALDLVSGPPFDKLRPGGWTWLYEGDRTDQHVQQAIVDVAQQVSRHYAARGELTAARRAAEVAVAAAPYDDAAQQALRAVSGASQHAKQLRL